MRQRNLLASGLLLLVVGLLGYRLPMAAAERIDLYQTMDPLTDILFFIDKKFYKSVDHEQLRQGAIQGMIDSLDDPYTEYIPPADLDDFNKAIRGEFVGIGAQVRTENGWLLIVTPLEDSPAYRAGIETDDLIVAVDGESTWQRDVNDIIEDLTGEPNTTVRVTVQRQGTKDDRPSKWLEPTVAGEVGDAPGPEAGSIRFDLEIVRQRIQTPTVKGIHRSGGEKWSYWIDPDARIGYVRVSQFTESTPAELEAACRELVDGGVRGMILDLRFNGGGSLSAAIRMADLFLSSGVIVSTQGRTTGDPELTRATSPGTLPDFPLVVVVNQSSASASEVVSGALVDNGRAIVLGERTFGKGIVQTLYPLPSGQGHLKITEQYYYLPSGRCIQRTDESTVWGVDPSDGFYVAMTDDEVRRMLRLRREEEIIRNGVDASEEDKWADPAWIEEHLGDPQLSAAVEAIKLKLAEGAWVPTGSEMPEGKLELVALQQEEERRELLIRELIRSEKRIETLSSVAPETDEDPLDIIPGDEDLTGGQVRITDAAGNTIVTLRITEADLERWLFDAPLAPLEEATDAEEAAPEPATVPE